MNVFYMLIALTAGLWFIKPAQTPSLDFQAAPQIENNVNSVEYWEEIQKGIDQQNAENEQKYNFNLEAPQPLPPIVVGVRS